MNAELPANIIGREALKKWQETIQNNIYTQDTDLTHTIQLFCSENFSHIHAELSQFGDIIPKKLEPLVVENHFESNLPYLENYNSIGQRIDTIRHDTSYIEAGNIIYSTGLLQKIATPGKLLEGLALFFLSSQAGEAGHNCPIACSAGVIRVLQRIEKSKEQHYFLEKLIAPSFQTNFTGAQFLTEIQGGSDVGLNAVYAEFEKNNIWKIYGEKWFCSNAAADLILLTARYNPKIHGTKGLGLFLIPKVWQGNHNHFTIQRLKKKIGTQTLATAEINFNGAYAYAMGNVENGFQLVMENVLHISRIFNTFTVLAMGRRAYHIALSYAHHRIAFNNPILNYPLVQEHLARIKAENTAMLAGIFATSHIQDQQDLAQQKNIDIDKNQKLLLRLLVNIQKYFSARLSVEHIHHSLDILAGNGAIETFSVIPRLLRDSIVCENWEGTHNTLRLQVLKDIQKYHIAEIFISYIDAEINKISGYKNEIAILAENLKNITHELQFFHKLPQNLQELQIRIIVDRMVTLYCALSLLIEAIDQIKQISSYSKLNCFYLFAKIHLQTKAIAYDERYLSLIKEIVTPSI